MTGIYTDLTEAKKVFLAYNSEEEAEIDEVDEADEMEEGGGASTEDETDEEEIVDEY